MNEKIREALDRSVRDAAWTENDTRNVLNRIEGEVRPRRKTRTALAIAFALLTALCLATALAGAVNEDFNAWIYGYWPDLASALMPVNLACEDSGIRMEVISAVQEGQDVLVIYSMEDLEGDRLREASVLPDLTYGEKQDRNWESGSFHSEYDPETKKTTFAVRLHYDDHYSPENGSLGFSVSEVWPLAHETVDLKPYYTQYADGIRAAPAPAVGETYVMGPYHGKVLPEGMEFIDSESSLEIPLYESVCLSGIGMIGNELHVQLHFTETAPAAGGRADGGFNQRPVYTGMIFLYDAEGNLLYSDGETADSLSIVSWGGDRFDPVYGSGMPEWREFFFETDPEAVRQADGFSLFIEKNLPAIPGNWHVDIPLRVITR